LPTRSSCNGTTDTHALVRVRVRRGKPACDGVHVGGCLFERDIGFHATDRVRAQIDASIAKGRVIPLPDRRVDVADVAVEAEAPRDHAHDRVRRAVERHRLANRVWRRTELTRPEAAAKDDHGPGAQLIVVGPERAAENRRGAQGREEVRRNHVPAQTFSGFAAREVVVFVPVERDR